MESFCQCGAMGSYPHNTECPYPYFGDSPKLVEKWTKEKERIKHNQLATLQILGSEGKYFSFAENQIL